MPALSCTKHFVNTYILNNSSTCKLICDTTGYIYQMLTLETSFQLYFPCLYVWFTSLFPALFSNEWIWYIVFIINHLLIWLVDLGDLRITAHNCAQKVRHQCPYSAWACINVDLLNNASATQRPTWKILHGRWFFKLIHETKRWR